jgi:ribosomal protein S12 methylthiotransferase accessory factor
VVKISDTATVRWRADLAALVVDGDASYLVSELDVLAIEGPLVDALVGCVDGTRGIDELVEGLSGRFEPERVLAALDSLAAQGLVVLSSAPSSPEVAFLEASGLSADEALFALGSSTVKVTDLVGGVEGRIASVLSEAGLAIASRVADADLEVVLVSDYLQPRLAEVNARHLRSGTPWLIVRPTGRVIWVGPVFASGDGACWSCLSHRLEANRQGHVYLASATGIPGSMEGPLVRHAGGDQLAAALVTLAVTKFLAGGAGEDVLRTEDVVTGESQRHPVVRRPQCPACGDPSLMSRRGLDAIQLTSRPKVAFESGGPRALSSSAMLDRYKAQVSPLTGVAIGLVDAPMPDDAFHLVVSGQNVARRPRGLEALRHGLRSASCGKGTTEVQARASALGEAIERCSGVYQGDEPRRWASLDDLGEDAIDPGACMLFSQRQYELRSIWNAGAAQFNFVFEPFDPGEKLDWSPMWSLTASRAKWLPTQYLYYGYPYEDRRVIAHADSNGCAAGTSLEDAMVQAICELVERDAVAIWWYNRLSRRGVDLASMRDPFVDRMVQVYDDLGRDVWALDLTSDLGIPVVGAFSRARSADSEDILIAFGAHLDPRIATLRALTEMNQFLTSVLPEFGGGPPHYSGDAAFATWCQSATVDEQSYLRPSKATDDVNIAQWPSCGSADILADLNVCVGRLESAGLEVLVLDQTRPDVGLPVVKVLAPGMRHFWPRFGPGRLYDVPVERGWVGSPTPEEELNPIGVFI